MVDQDRANMRTALSLVAMMGVIGVLALVAFLWHGPLALPVSAAPAASASP